MIPGPTRRTHWTTGFRVCFLKAVIALPHVMSVVMRLRSLLLVGSLVVALSILLAVSIFGLRASTIAVSMGVASYARRTGDLLAYITLTNRGNVSIAVPLRYRCEVENAGGWTNYTADTRHTIFLQPEQMVVFSRTNYAVPLPPDTRIWTLKLQVRQQTRKESLIHALQRWGVVKPRVLSRLFGPPEKDEAFRWTDCQSGSFEVPLGASRPGKEP
ncbi:MAG TPA: hypothetical protein VJA21_06505 [Verrucomicrobiae bacterium]